MTRARGCGGCLVLLLLLLGVPIGASLWLDVAGRVHTGVITLKHERIQVTRDGDWTRRYRLVLAPTGHSGLGAVVGVTEAEYDRLGPGDSVRVRTSTAARLSRASPAERPFPG